MHRTAIQIHGRFVVGCIGGVGRIGVCQCTAAIHILVHRSTRHVDSHVARHVGQVAAAIDIHTNGTCFNIYRRISMDSSFVAAAIDRAGHRYLSPGTSCCRNKQEQEAPQRFHCHDSLTHNSINYILTHLSFHVFNVH